MSNITNGEYEGVIAPQKSVSFRKKALDRQPLWIALDEVQDPQVTFFPARSPS